MHIIMLPVGIFEQIIHHIHSSKDLFALALTARVLSAFIIPFYLQIRRIRCLTDESTLWLNLRKRHDLCLQIREIELYEGIETLHLPRRPHIPQCLLDMETDPTVLWPSTDVVWNEPMVGHDSTYNASGSPEMHARFTSSFKEATRYQHIPFSAESSLSALCGTLPLLTNLTRFSLKVNCLFFGVDLFKTILAVIHSNCGLRELAIACGSTRETDFDAFDSKLSDLTSFEFSAHSSWGDDPYPDQLIEMLVKQCPDLTNLALGVHMSGPNIDKMWGTANWKQLRRLYIEHQPLDVEIFEEFLKRHPQLEYLETSVVSLDLGPLNHLRALGLPYIGRTKDVLNRLKYLCIWGHRCEFEGNIRLASSLFALVTASPCNPNWEQFTAALPSSLERLCIKDLDLSYLKNGDVGKYLRRILQAILESKLKSLTHLCFSAPSAWMPEFQTKDFLGRLAHTLPSLKYFGLARTDMRESWIRIHRDGEGRYMGYELDDTVEEVQTWASIS